MTALLLAAAAAAGAAGAAAALYPQPRMDARLELLAAVQLLAGAETRFSGHHERDSPYSRALGEWVAPFRGHPAVARYAAHSERGVDYLAWYQFILGLDPPPALKPREQFSHALAAGFGGELAAEEMRLLLADFARETGFMEFYERRSRRLREAVLSDARRGVREARLRERAQSYWGAPLGLEYALLVSPFAESSLATTVRMSEGLASVYGPESTPEGPRFAFSTRLGAAAAELFYARLLEAAEPHRARIAESAALFTPVAGLCAADWFSCVQRHAAFAAGARVLAAAGQTEAAAEWPLKYSRLGLPYLEPLVAALARYETERSRWKSFLDFYPELLAALEAQAPAAVPFAGGLAELYAAKERVVLILPEGALAAKARARFPKAEALSGEQALARRLAGRTLVAVGPASSNAWLARRWEELHLPVQAGPESLSFTPRFQEAALVFPGRPGLVSVALNPDDPGRGLLLLTGYDEQAAALALEAPPARADFILRGKGGTLKTGLYERTRRPWRLR